MVDIQHITTLVVAAGGTATMMRYAVNSVTTLLQTLERICQKASDAWTALKRRRRDA